MTTVPLIIIFLSFIGFLIAWNIHHKKTSGEKLVCLVGKDCDAVIHSQYSEFLGIPNAILGMFYFAFVALSYGAHMIYPSIGTPAFVFVMLSVSALALLFSLYLTLIQTLALRTWCEWCVLSALISVSIFALAFVEYNENILELLRDNYQLIAILHGIGAAIGVGGATITDVFFFKFLKDFRISEYESEILNTISQIIWAALALIVLTGIALYLPNVEALNANPKFLIKMIVVSVLIMNGVILNFAIAPKLISISFGEKHDHQSGELHLIRKTAFALGSVSIISWYSAFVLGSIRSINLDFWMLFLIYLLLLTMGILASQIMERILEIKSSEK